MDKKRLGRGLSSLIPNYGSSPPPLSPDLAENDSRPDGSQGTPHDRRDLSNADKPESTHSTSGTAVHPASGPTTTTATIPKTRMDNVSVDRITVNPFQPRGPIDESSIRELARSIKTSGIVQPIVVRANGDKLQIIAGERRWRAARAANLETVPVVIREATDEDMLEWALVENIHREDLNAIDRALAYRRYCEAFNIRPDVVARKLGEDRSTVANYLRLLELPTSVQDLVSRRQISMGHARSLLGVTDELRQMELAADVVEKNLSVRSLESLVRRERPRRSRTKEEAPPPPTPEAHIRELEEKFEMILKTKVRIELGRPKGSGHVMIEFRTVDDFDRICKCIGFNSNEST